MHNNILQLHQLIVPLSHKSETTEGSVELSRTRTDLGERQRDRFREEETACV